MAIAPTGAIYKALEFDGTSSRTFGVYITGEAVYNAPQRDVEMISIPGRNGAYALDKGRFENIEVTYPAGIFADTETDFAGAISDFRNYLCSRNGYVRLTDEYNPNEYRMAVYKSGLEVEPALLKGGEFDITFECKPQRWLTSGESKVSLQDGESITNPTLFDSSPLLEVEGYGTIGFNGHGIEIERKEVGDIVLKNAQSFSLDIPFGQGVTPINLNGTITLDTSQLNNGDAISLVGVKAVWAWNLNQVHGSYVFDYVTLDSESGITADTSIYANGSKATITSSFTSIPLIFGTASTATHRTAWNYSYGIVGGSSVSGNDFKDVNVVYDGAQTITITVSGDKPRGTKAETVTFTISEIDAYSTIIVTDTIYADCDLGEAYYFVNNEAADANSFVSFGSDLPTLASGANTITYDNTFTSVKITPRWWKV